MASTCQCGRLQPLPGRLPSDRHRLFRHGDDFVALCRRAAVVEFSRELGNKLIVKVRGALRPRPDLGDVEEIVILNRVARLVRATAAAPEKIERG